MKILMRFSWLTASLLVLAGCTSDYPLDREGTWSIPPVSANEANLRAQIVNPQDLVSGRGEPNVLGAEGTPPVKSLLAGKRPPLPDLSASTIYGVPSSGGGSSGGNGQ
jgi:hypothetical protein